VAGVFHQVPAVGDLYGVRQGLGCRERIAAAPIARDVIQSLVGSG